jgi:2-polyprenyl-6-methoxyphenol hydroxylase-like FAD-dependent oxidoreductase
MGDVPDPRANSCSPLRALPSSYYFDQSSESTSCRCQPDAIFLDQDQVDGIVRERLKEFGCLADLGAEFLSFDQSGERVSAKLSTKTGSTEINVKYLIGTDGAKGFGAAYPSDKSSYSFWPQESCERR